MADEKGHRPSWDEKISSPSPDSSGQVGDMPIKDVTTDDPTQNEYYRQFAENGAEWRADFEKKLKRKVDIRLIPLLVIMYINNFMDRSALGQARLGTLEEDLGMDPNGTEFNTAISILFVGYIIMQLPSNLLLSRLRPSLYLGSVMVIWGAVCTCTAAVQNFAGLLVVRILLGVTEAPFFPGAIFLMSSWYTRRELTKRIAWFYSGVAVANGFSGLVSAGILANMEGAAGIAGWRWVFIVNGAISMFFAICCTLVLPDFPHTTKWLTPEQRAYAAWRLKMDAEEEDDRHATGVLAGLMMALKDWRLYIFMLMLHANVLAGTFQYIFPSIVQTLGFGRIQTLLLTMPIGAVSAFPVMTAWIANSFIRPLVKRASAIAICNSVANAASAYGTFMYPASQAPQYMQGSAGNACVCLAAALLALALRIIYKRENKKLEKMEAEGIADPAGVAGGDQRGLGFRYVY
ncbi:hypothetical protein H2200_013248 [Cladophialophora chaetospira]|uniref:Major facilitator superfamily (MFS) profile domain-containing protein n=1 Tax=Cladophialophora chaetospira TaxID=386627 RepID=A0AA38WWF8_9EURO|nr:hypothetical protein H2200_013248 [Cladophialophora chaetospira]